MRRRRRRAAAAAALAALAAAALAAAAAALDAAGLGGPEGWDAGHDGCAPELPRRRGAWLEAETRETFPPDDDDDGDGAGAGTECAGFAYGQVARYAFLRNATPVAGVSRDGAAVVLDNVWRRWETLFTAARGAQIPRALHVSGGPEVTRLDRVELLVTDPVGKLSQTLPSAGAIFYVRARIAGRDDQERFILLHRDGKIYLHGRLSLLRPQQAPCTAETSSLGVSVLSFNVWNTMPHLGAAWNTSARDARYERRLDLLVDTIRKANADIVMLQEVRFDPTFGIGHAPCQLEHLMRRLASYPYFVHQPAMAFVGAGFAYEGDEGVSILSRYPIVHSSYKLLSRKLGHAEDFHQRVCLHARVALPQRSLIDVFTSHFSLYPAARLRGAREVVAFADENLRGQGKAASVAGQIFAGDVNDEPGSPALAPLGTRGFRDVWLATRGDSAEPQKGSRDPFHLEQAYTFPSDEPKKRIDLMFARGARLRATDIRLVGQRALHGPGSAAPQKKSNASAAVGMEHPASPIWASDHRGVLAHFAIDPVAACCELADVFRG